jgi:hypothetical protein
MKLLLLALLCLVTFNLTSCSYAQSNVQTLITTDCGVTWKLIKAGETIPNTSFACSYTTSIPNYPMQGEVAFKANFKRVKARVNASYDYDIVDPTLFIQEAKYLARKGSGTDEASGDSRFEGAENSVIDKRIKELSGSMLAAQDIVEFDPSEFEDRLLVEMNKVLAQRGVRLNFITFVSTPDEQTRQAIDVVTAYRIYTEAGIKEEGKAIIVAKAGAANINMVTNPAKEQDSEDAAEAAEKK